MPGKVCSHPSKSLEKHLFGVLNLARGIAHRFSLDISSEQEKALLFHDIAKAHLNFQIKLCKRCNLNQQCADGIERKLNKPKKIYHAEPSAALVLAVTGDVAAAEAVRRHHTGIENLDEVKKFWIDELEYFNSEKTGIHDIISRLPWWEGAEKLAAMAGLSGHDWASLLPEKNEWPDFAFDRMDEFDFEGPPRFEKWLNQRIFYSLLITADRWEAAVGEKLEYKDLVIEVERIDEYLKDKVRDNLFEWRDNIRRNVVKNAKEIITSPGIYTLTLPTGTGKTITGLQLAMDVAKRFNASGIVYVLPFVSLVEQNAGVAAKLFDSVQEDHHLAYFTEVDGTQENEIDYAQKFISIFRYWQEPVVVTTMSKLWEVLFSPHGNDTMSLHRLSKAVVLLDEPQSIRAQCWEGFGNTLKLLSEKLGTTFILMTATQPEIALGQELAPEPVSFPKARHEIRWLKDEFQKERMTITDIVAFLDKEGVKSKDTLVVANTREAALEMYFGLRKLGITPFFLSRWVTPKDRNNTIEAIKAKEKNNELRWVVSTQVIEAGMDMDFAMVFRDLGPLDSIIQVAGRCNRHGARDELGKVYVGELFDERSSKNKSFCSLYDKVLITQTRNLLNEYNSFREDQCTAIVSLYYRAVKDAIAQSSLWDNITDGNWGDFIGLFDEKPLPEEMLVIDYDGTIALRLEMILNMPNSLENMEERRRVFGILNQNSISVPTKYLDEWQYRYGDVFWDGREEPLLKMANGLWLLKPEGIGKIYRPDICFIPPHFADEYASLLENN